MHQPNQLGQLTLLSFLFIGLGAFILFTPEADSQRVWSMAAPRTEAPSATPSPTTTATVPPTATDTPPPTVISTMTLPPTPTPTETPAPTQTQMPTITPTTPLTASPTPSPTIPASERSLLVDQDEQMMYVYEGEQLIHTIPVSTGAPITNKFTPSWAGQVGSEWSGGPIGRDGFYTDYIWYLFAGPEGSILIHSLPYKKEGKTKQYDQPEALGVRPVSHGCVRISPKDAAWLQTWNPTGTSITITPLAGVISDAENLLLPTPTSTKTLLRIGLARAK